MIKFIFGDLFRFRVCFVRGAPADKKTKQTERDAERRNGKGKSNLTIGRILYDRMATIEKRF